MKTMTTPVTQSAIEDVIKSRIDPYLGMDLYSAKAVKSVDFNADENAIIEIAIEFGFPVSRYSHTIEQSYRDQMFELFNIPAMITCSPKIIAHKVQKDLKPLPNIKNIIVVSSAKGGVGKSTTAINLALALQYEGANVGILDADIYGPSLPKMIGKLDKPESKDGESIEPIIAYGLQTMSIGYMIDEKDPAIWRAPMAVQALLQLLNETNWDNLDYLIIDMPPGTGDIQLTLAQKIPVAGAVIITTPQDLAMIDARKGLNMFKKMGISILGIIENMSTHICSQCGYEEAIFGSDGGANLALESQTRLLGKMPLDIRIRKEIDNSKPTVALNPNSELSLKYRELALNLAATLSLQPKDYAAKFPNIVVEN